MDLISHACFCLYEAIISGATVSTWFTDLLSPEGEKKHCIPKLKLTVNSINKYIKSIKQYQNRIKT
jgi:hypothetical protein